MRSSETFSATEVLRTDLQASRSRALSTAAGSDVRELSDEQGMLGIEFEEPDDFAEIERPYDPESIRVTTKSFSLRNIVDLIDEEALDLAPDFQRLRVWKPVQKAQLIESILLQIPLPAFYFAEDDDGILRVVDGVQRLSTIHDFVRGGPNGDATFALNGVEYVQDVQGKRFADLPPLWQRRLHNTQIIAHVIDPTTPRPVMYDIFRRINTGGTPLNAQEIRHCMSRDRSRSFLRDLTLLDEFDIATSGLLRNQRRMIDKEVALRFVAFMLRNADDFVGRTMEEFLWETTASLDDPDVLSDADLQLLKETFRVGLIRSSEIFGEYAFRKWPLDDDRRKPFNRALFESWTVVLADPGLDLTRGMAADIRAAAREAMTHDDAYISAITASTGDRRRVRTRFAVARQIVASVG